MCLNFFYVNSLLLLFINFYVRTYVLTRRRGGKAENTKVTSNGIKVINNGAKVISNGAVGVPLEDKKYY